MKCILNNSTLPFAFVVSVTFIAVNTVFIHFVHYDSQNRFLDSEHYNVEVITAEDHKQLSNPENRTVKLSNGDTVTNRSDTWYSHALPKYKPVNNDSQYVLVTLRGTAPFVHRWYESAVMPIVAVVLAIPLINIIIRKRLKKPQKKEI